MSTSEKSEKDLNEEVPKNNKENLKTEKIKEKLIDPLSLLSSDLLKEINNIDEKKEISDDNTQKESDENESDDSETNPPSINNGLNNDLLNFKIFKNEEKIKPKQQSSSCLNNINLNLNLFNNDNSMFAKQNIKRPNNNCCYNCPNRNNYNKDYNNNMNMNLNNFSDKLNFFNNSFTMNGKQGWICTSCKNFNYESKYLIILFIHYSQN